MPSADESFANLDRPSLGRPTLVGRPREVAVLEKELARAAAGDFRCVLIVGEPGVGKTRLATELRDRHSEGEIRLLARSYPLGGSNAFGLWAEALERHLRGLPKEEVSELVGGFADDLAHLLRSVAALRGASPGFEPPRVRLLEGLAFLLENLARQAPVLVVLDDVHLSDASSWEALHYLASDLPDERLLVVATARHSELAGQRIAVEILHDLEQQGRMRRMQLRPLDRDAVGHLVRHVLQVDPPGSLIDWLNARSRGNPLFALGLLEALLEEGADLANPSLRRVPEGLEERIERQLLSLDVHERSILEALSVLGRPLNPGELALLTDDRPETVEDLLSRLVRAGLLSERDEGRDRVFEILHPLMQEAIYQAMGPGRRRQLHRQIGRGLLNLECLAEAALHLAKSATVGDIEAIDALRDAVKQAEARQAYRESLAIMGALIDLLPPGDDRWLELLEVISRQPEWLIDHRAEPQVVDALVKILRQINLVLERSDEPGRQATFQLRLATFLAYGTGELEEAERAAERSRDLFRRAQDATGEVQAQLRLGAIGAIRGEIPAWRTQSHAALEDAQAIGERRLQVEAAMNLGFANFFLGRFTDAEAAYRESLGLARRDSRQQRAARALLALAASLGLEGRGEEAQALLAEAKAIDPDWEDSFLAEWEMLVAWLAGRSDLLHARALAAGGVSGISKRRGVGVVLAAVACAETAPMFAAEKALAAARAVYRERDWLFYRQYCDWAEAILAWRRGSPEQALATLPGVADRVLRMGASPFAAFPLLDVAELAAESGDTPTAKQAAVKLRNIARQVDRPAFFALADIAAGWAGTGAEEAAHTLARARNAHLAIDRSGWKPWTARSLHLIGVSLARDPQHHRLAGETLEAAARLFEESGAIWRRDRVLARRRALASSAKPAARSAARTPTMHCRVCDETLTPREREVLRLLAAGKTNPEIASELVISALTVQRHVANIYSKIGAHNRVQASAYALEHGISSLPPSRTP